MSMAFYFKSLLNLWMQLFHINEVLCIDNVQAEKCCANVTSNLNTCLQHLAKRMKQEADKSFCGDRISVTGTKPVKYSTPSHERQAPAELPFFRLPVQQMVWAATPVRVLDQQQDSRPEALQRFHWISHLERGRYKVLTPRHGEEANWESKSCFILHFSACRYGPHTVEHTDFCIHSKLWGIVHEFKQLWSTHAHDIPPDQQIPPTGNT